MKKASKKIKVNRYEHLIVRSNLAKFGTYSKSKILKTHTSQVGIVSFPGYDK